MTTEAEGGVDGFEGGEKTLCLFGTLESLHLPFASPCRLMGVLASIVQIATLPVFYLGQDPSLGCGVASQLVRNDDARNASRGAQKSTKEAQCSPAVPLRLDQNVDGDAVLVHTPPQVVLDAIDLEEDFVQMPFRADLSSFLSQLGGVEATELLTPFPDGLIRQRHTASSHHLFDIAIAQREPKIQPDANAPLLQPENDDGDTAQSCSPPQLLTPLKLTMPVAAQQPRCACDLERSAGCLAAELDCPTQGHSGYLHQSPFNLVCVLPISDSPDCVT